jgi:Rrf2 family iron-sulfur cluster assembly transcriptional regulator
VKLSTRSRYGLRALVAVARSPESLVTAEILADGEEVSKRYLDEILRTLRKSGFLKSSRGRKGGYTLARSPEEINLLDIVDALEGSTELVPCVDDAEICNRSPDCPTRPIWTAATAQLREVFSGMNLAAFLECPDEKCAGPTLLQLSVPPHEPSEPNGI